MSLKDPRPENAPAPNPSSTAVGLAAQPSGWRPWAFAALVTSASLGITLAFEAVIQPTVFIVFFPAVVLSAWYGGRGPAVLSTTLSVLASDFFLIEPTSSLAVDHPWAAARLGLFFAVGVLISFVTASLRTLRTEAAERALKLEHVAEERARLYRAERSARRRLEVLAEAGRVFSASLSVEATFRTLVHFMTENLADRAVAYLVDPAGEHLVTVATAGREAVWEGAWQGPTPGPEEPLTADSEVGRVVLSGETSFTPEVPRGAAEAWAAGAPGAAPPRSSVVVPLKARGHTVGALVVATVEGGRPPYSEGDVWLIEELALRAGIAAENARLFEAAQSANAAKSRFLSSMSHELRTPLHAIAGHLDLLEAGLHGPVNEEQRDAVQRMKRSQRHLLRLIEDVLEFASMEVGRIQFDTRDIAIEGVLEALRSAAENQARERGVHFACPSAPLPVAFRGDPDRALQILSNLVTNALKFTPRGGAVRVRVEEGPEHLRVHVEDSGPGIPADRLESIFDPFTQLEEAKTGSRWGVGLGLTISRELARAMGGDLTVQSEHQVGSTFTLTLPRASGAAPTSRLVHEPLG